MKSLVRVGVVLAVVLLAHGNPPAFAQSSENATPEMKYLLSRLQAMSHGYYPAQEWNKTIEDIHALISASEKSGDLETVIDVTAVLANVYSAMQGNHRKGIAVLLDLKILLEGKPVQGMHKIYVRMSEIYSRAGDETAIEKLIQEFKESPHYKPQSFAITPATAPGEPWAIERPFAAGDDSLTVITMKRFLREARFSPGKPFPDVDMITRSGTVIEMSSLRGEVVLIDFWLKGWTAWERDLPGLARLYQKYRPHGFAVIGVPLQEDFPDMNAFLAENRMGWDQALPTAELRKSCGVTGDATSFLVDGNGLIIGRNLRGSDLSAAVRKAVGL